MISWNMLFIKNQNISFPKIKSKFYNTAFNLFARLFICFCPFIYLFLPVYLFVFARLFICFLPVYFYSFDFGKGMG